ncbi:methyltransferase domain-containing protein [Actinomadura namibiensis]|uniref:SAM-dependent methyltransferase n=1 Tax=Actinomadura namibiensis TaxID=182080 RepID=A0A7W3LSX5_ACTNM|nr:SAM-dependent methyltransferase [Actinomadura namibiensis]
MVEDVRGVAVAAQQARRLRGGARVRGVVLWDALRTVLDRIAPEGPSDVVDVGGGTGGFAVPLAELGHRVTVVDESPDALAALERRAAESGVTVRALQGDVVDLPDLLGTGSADLVLSHSVLEYVDDPAAAMAAITQAVRPGGSVSVLVAGQVGAALHRAVAGHFQDARRVLDDPDGRWGDHDRTPRRFTRESLTALAEDADLRVAELHGVRIFADLVPGSLLDGETDSAEALLALERAAAVHPVLRELATQLHLVADRK